MARIARVVLPDFPHHVTQRGVRSMPVFFSDEDRIEYLRLMAERGPAWGLRVYSWCLMTNHLHLIMVPESAESLARGIGKAHRRYTRAVNFRQGVRRYLFQGRFNSCPLDERHAVAAARYVEQNPLRARLVGVACEYRWSSAGYHPGVVDRDPLVVKRGFFGLVRGWRRLLLEEPAEVEVLRRGVPTGRPCGGKRFVRVAERVSGRALRPGTAGRPRQTEE